MEESVTNVQPEMAAGGSSSTKHSTTSGKFKLLFPATTSPSFWADWRLFQPDWCLIFPGPLCEMQESCTMATPGFNMLLSHSIESWATDHACHLCTMLPEWVRPTDLLCSLPHYRPTEISSPWSRSQQVKKNLACLSPTHVLLIMAGVEKSCRKGVWVTLCTLPSWEDVISAYFPGLPFQTWCFEWDLSHPALEIYIWASHLSYSMKRNRHVWGVNHLIYFIPLL